MEIKLPFGVRDNKIVHISEILPDEKGLKCNCICPKCGERLIAKMGPVRIRHFSHSNVECRNALETALHRFAKEILQKNMQLKLPDLTIEYDENFQILKDSNTIDTYYEDYIKYEGIHTEKIEIVKNFILKFDKIELERKINNIIPDIIVYKNNIPLMIEIAVTHFVNEEKLKKIKKISISTIEINLNADDIDYVHFDRDIIENMIINETKNKKWIFNNKEENIKNEIHQKEKILRKKREEQKEMERIIHEKKLKEKIKLFNEIQKNSSVIEEKNKNSLLKNKLWIYYLKKFNISASNIPKHINIKIPGELLFKCDHKLWEMCIYDKFILNRKGKTIYIFNVVRWIKRYSQLQFHKELAYTRDVEMYDIPDMTDVIEGYFNKLCEYGILIRLSRQGFYSSFMVRKDELLPEYSKSRIIDEYVTNINNTNNIKPKQSMSVIYDKKGTCLCCGQITSDWIVYNGKDGTCICRLEGKG